MANKQVKVGDEVKNKCPVCGNKETERFTFNGLRNTKKGTFGCYGCFTTFWFYPRTGKITVKKIDKSGVGY